MSTSTIPPLPKELEGQLDVLMIDNFDSFTWNLYQQLCLLGARVTVVRNDAIVEEHFPLLKLNFLLISPGPGHPKTDSGVSKQAIKYFTGKIPILGVCMGLECLIDLHGGDIGYVVISVGASQVLIPLPAVDMRARSCTVKPLASATTTEDVSRTFRKALPPSDTTLCPRSSLPFPQISPSLPLPRSPA